MKKYLFLVMLLPVLLFGQTTKYNYPPTYQWTTSGTNLYYLLGNVGIGTSSPTTPLMVNGVISASGGNSTLWNDCLTISSAQSVTGAKIFMANKLLLDANGYGTRTLTLLATGTLVSKTITFPDANGTVALTSNIPTDIMTLTTGQDVLGIKTYHDGTLKLLNAGETYSTILKARVSSSIKNINFPDSSGTVALLSNCGTPGNYVTLTNDQDISGAKSFYPAALKIYSTGNTAQTVLSSLASHAMSRTIDFPDASGTVALTSDLPASSQWTTSGTAIYYTTGRVGVGITNPHQIFENKGTFQSAGGLIELNDSSNYDTKINTGTSTGAVTIGGTANQTIDIGVGAAVKTVSIGSTNTTSTSNISSGSGGINFNVGNSQPTNINTGTNTGTVTIGGSATIVNISTGSGTGAITLGGNGTQTIGIGNSGLGAKTTTIGNTVSGTQTDIKTYYPGISVPVYSRLTGDVSTTSTSLVDITGLSIALVASAVYEFEANLIVTVSNNTGGTSYGVQYSSSGANVYSTIIGTYSASAAASGKIVALNTASAAYLSGANNTGEILIKGIFTTGANGGNITIQHLKVSSGTSYVNNGSFLKVTRIS